MYIIASDFFEKDDNYVFKSDNYSYLYIRNLENSRFKPGFR